MKIDKNIADKKWRLSAEYINRKIAMKISQVSAVT